MAEIDDKLMETQGHLNLSCAKCGAHARLERPTYFECYLVAKGWVCGEETCFTDSIGGDDRLVILLEGARADDLLTAGDDEDDLHPSGTMSWLLIDNGEFNDDAAAEFRDHIFGLVDQDAPADDQPRPPVADLVDHLDLFEGEDDEDIPF